MKLSIIIPCYNEEKMIKVTLKKIGDYFQNRDEKFEIIVIDDGSKDNTFQVVKDFDPDIKILKNNKNQGKGYSVKRGMLASSGDIALLMDADSSTDIKELDKFFPYFQSHDIVIGSRHLSVKYVIVPQSFIRRYAGYVAHKLISLILRVKVKDTMCGFKAFNRRSKDILFKKQLNNGFGFDYEIIFLAEKFKFKIKEVPIVWRASTKSGVTLKGYLIALYELFIIRINYLLRRYE